jgi:hypothetical protein
MTLGHRGRLGETLCSKERVRPCVSVPVLVFLVTLESDGFWLASHSAAHRMPADDQ